MKKSLSYILKSVVLSSLVGCSTVATTCVSDMKQNKTILNEAEQTFRCECTCPQTKNLVNAGGILGGLLNWFDSDGL